MKLTAEWLYDHGWQYDDEFDFYLDIGWDSRLTIASTDLPVAVIELDRMTYEWNVVREYTPCKTVEDMMRVYAAEGIE